MCQIHPAFIHRHEDLFPIEQRSGDRASANTMPLPALPGAEAAATGN